MSLLLVGDTIIDKNIYSECVGLSLESPTLKTNYVSSEIKFGGAAAVAEHLTRLGSEVTFVTSMSNLSMEKFKSKNKNVNLVVVSKIENCKTRHYIKRGDNQYKYLQINDVNRQEIKYNLNLDLKKFEKIAVSDYRCGLLNSAVQVELLKGNGKTYAASQESDLGSNLLEYNLYDFIVCNHKESKSLPRKNNVVITMGSEGSCLNGIKYKTRNIPPEAIKTTIGAGDSFYACYLATECIQTATEYSTRYVEGSL